MPPTRPDAITSQVELRGDIKAAEAFVPVAHQQMAAMHQQNVNGLEIMDRPVNLGGGNRMLCQRRFGEDKALISVPGKGGQKGPFHLNFDASVVDKYNTGFVPDKFWNHQIYYPESSGYYDSMYTGNVGETALQFGDFGPSGKLAFGVSATANPNPVGYPGYNDYVYRGNYGNYFSSIKEIGSKTVGLVYNTDVSRGSAGISKDYNWPGGFLGIYVYRYAYGETSPGGGSFAQCYDLRMDNIPNSGVIFLKYDLIGFVVGDNGYPGAYRYNCSMYLNGSHIGSKERLCSSDSTDHYISSDITCSAVSDGIAPGGLYPTTSISACPQFFIYSHAASYDDIQRSTDKLATKWGF